MVRRATVNDVLALLAMGKAFHAASKMPFSFNNDAMAAVLRNMLDSEKAVVLITDRGTIGGMLNHAYCDPTWVYAVEMFWWARGDGMALLRAFEEWAQNVGANEIRMTTLPVLPRADTLLRGDGYTPAEVSYAKVI